MVCLYIESWIRVRVWLGIAVPLVDRWLDLLFCRLWLLCDDGGLLWQGSIPAQKKKRWEQAWHGPWVYPINQCPCSVVTLFPLLSLFCSRFYPKIHPEQSLILQGAVEERKKRKRTQALIAHWLHLEPKEFISNWLSLQFICPREKRRYSTQDSMETQGRETKVKQTNLLSPVQVHSGVLCSMVDDDDCDCHGCVECANICCNCLSIFDDPCCYISSCDTREYPYVL